MTNEIYTKLLDVAMNHISDLSGKKNFLHGVAHNNPWWINEWQTKWVNKTTGAIARDYDFKERRLEQALLLMNADKIKGDKVYDYIDQKLQQAMNWYSFFPHIDETVKHSDDVSQLSLLKYVMSQIKDDKERNDFLNSAIYSKPWWLDIDHKAVRHFERENVSDKDVKVAALGNAIALWGHPIKTDKMTLYTYIDKMMYKDYVKTGVVEANKKD